VAARIEKLEDEGIICGYHADISLDKMGYHITAFINLEMTPKQKALFLAYMTDVSITPFYFVVQGLELIKVVIGFILVKKGIWVRNIVSGKTEDGAC